MQCAKFVILRLLRAYKWAVSPMFPPACRYQPTCSEYAMEAVDRYGALRGGWMALTRLLRCHPLGGSGHDPVVKSRNRLRKTVISRIQGVQPRSGGRMQPRARALGANVGDSSAPRGRKNSSPAHLLA